MSKIFKISIITFIISLSIFIVSIVIYVNNSNKQKSCYQLLLDEDYIGVGCDKYFRNDKWYIEYKKESE